MYDVFTLYLSPRPDRARRGEVYAFGIFTPSTFHAIYIYILRPSPAERGLFCLFPQKGGGAIYYFSFSPRRGRGYLRVLPFPPERRRGYFLFCLFVSPLHIIATLHPSALPDRGRREGADDAPTLLSPHECGEGGGVGLVGLDWLVWIGWFGLVGLDRLGLTGYMSHPYLGGT